MRRATIEILVLLTVLALLFGVSNGRSVKRKTKKSMVLRQKETNAIDFIRLAVMRLIYGVATRVGLGEQISGALNGAFVPPGVDDYGDYDGFNLFDRDDDYDY